MSTSAFLDRLTVADPATNRPYEHANSTGMVSRIIATLESVLSLGCSRSRRVPNAARRRH